MVISLENKTTYASDLVKKTGMRHVAVIMDGNRRWAKQRNLPSQAGHNAGVKSLRTIVSSCGKLGIDYLTVYAFSTENWGRKKEEVDFLMFLLGETIKKEVKNLHANNVKVKIIGNMTMLSKELQKILNDAMNKTSENTGLCLQIAINYGSRDEIKNAVQKIAADAKSGLLSVEDITEDTISDYLYTSNIPDPDLLIRTGGDQRVSNYLLWQIAYSEIIITDTLWPDFNQESLEDAVIQFSSRDRRFGKG